MRRATTGLTALIAGAWLIAAPGCAREAPPPPNLVLIVVDTLRADHLGAWGYTRETSPAIDAFAADAVRFSRAYATAPWTKPSLGSILSGVWPSTHGTQHLDSSLPTEVDTLGEMLQRVGVRTSAVVSHSLIGPLFNFHQGFDAFDAAEGKGHDHVSTPGVTARAIARLDALAAAGEPFFLFVHYFDPHFAYRRHPEVGFATGDPGRLVGGEPMPKLRALGIREHPDEVRFVVDSYDEEIRFTDAGIGELLAALRARGLYDGSVIVLTADHGESFFEHGWLGHTRSLYDTLVHVPLLLRLPGGGHAGRVIDEPVSLLAIAPTVLDAMGFDTSELPFQDGSLLPLIQGEAPGEARLVYSEVDYDRRPRPALWDRIHSADMHAVVRGRHKLIHDRGRDVYALYDLLADPGETRDLAAEQPEVVAALRRELEAASARARAEGGAEAERRALDAGQQDELRALGYIAD